MTFYRKILADLSKLDYREELMAANGICYQLDRGDWEALLHGRLPKSRLESRAGYAVTKKFVVEYWRKWNPQKDTGVSKESACV